MFIINFAVYRRLFESRYQNYDLFNEMDSFGQSAI